MDQKQQVINILSTVLDGELTKDEITNMIEIPKSSDLGDYAFPTFLLAKFRHQAPQQIASDIVEKLDKSAFEKVQATGAYVNFFLNKSDYSVDILKTILTQKEHYGDANVGKGGNVTIDMSSPNIAKPFSMGHLRSTVIGNAIANIITKVGYHPIKINHLGDWGTQFGKLMVAYMKWGNEADVKQDPINTLLKYYVRFHKEAETNPELNDEARLWFKKLEDGDEKATYLWKWFRDESLKEFKRIYDELGIDFDHYTGESFYNDKMQAVVDELKQKHLLEKSRGAEIVNLDKFNLNPALILKSDGATLYITRDLATAIYRHNTFHFVKSLYVVGMEQEGHFKQLKAVLSLMGDEWAKDIKYIGFGLITQNGKKLSTRKGNIVLLENVLQDATKLALDQINEKHPDLPNKEEVAHDVGVGAVIFHDLKNNRLDSFDFNLEEVVRFEGETGPYVQYTNVRAQSILRKANVKHIDPQSALTLSDPNAWDVLKSLGDYPATVLRANNDYEPSVIAKYALHLSKAFNKYYANSKVLVDDDEKNARLALVESVSIVLQNALALLGVKAPAEM